jgi:hypothetical protein
MTIEEMTTFVNAYNPIRNFQVRIVLDHYIGGLLNYKATEANMTFRSWYYLIEDKQPDPELVYSLICRTIIYIPRSIFFLKEDQIKAMLIHEMGHLTNLIGFRRTPKNGRFATHIERLADLYSIRNHHDMTQFLSDSIKEYSGRDRFMIQSRLDFCRKIKEIHRTRKTKKNKDSTYPIQN